MFKANRLLAIIVLFLFVVCMGSCGGGGGGGDSSGPTPPLPEPSTQGDISQYSAGDIEDPNFNGIGIDEGVGVSTLSTRKYDLTITSETCGPMGTGFGGYARNNCTEWVAVRRCEKGDPSVVWPGSGRHAKKWLDLAKENGYETGTIPQPGAVAVFWLSYDPCPAEESCKNKALYEYGHVAYVESVEKDINGIVTKWTISEYNYINKEALGYREFFSVTISDKQAPALIGFIYGTKTLPSSDTVPPSTPTGLIGNAISSSHINLSWTASTDNVGVAGYKIYRSGYYLKSVPTAFTSDTGLTPSTQYCYTVSAYDAANNESGKSNQACATTLTTSDTTPPSIPTGLSATAVSSSQINLSWNASTDNVGVTGYKIFDYYGTYLKTVNSTSASFTGLSPNTNYCFTVSAYDAAGNESGKSSQVCSTTPSGGGVPPGALTLTVTLECSGEGTPQIRLTWTSSIGVDYYNIYKNGSLYEGVSSNVTTFVDTAVTTGMTYSYFIRAINSGGQTDSKSVTLTTTCQGILPGIFTLTATPWCNGSNPIIHLEWGGSAGRTLPYELYRNGTLMFTTDFNNYDDTAVTAGTTYNYFVRAKNSVGYRDSNTVPVTSKSDCGAPVSPVINTISPQSVTVGDGGFTLTITGQYFDSTAKILWAFSGQTPATVVYPTFVDSSTLTVQVTQNSGGFSPFLYPGALVIQVIKPGPNFWDGQRSNIMSFTIFNPVPIVNSISGTCRANLNCTPSNGFDVKINGSGFVNNLVSSSISSSYAEINGSSTPVSLIGQGPVTSQMQLYVNGSLIPTPGTYTVNVCNAGTIQGTACSTGSLTVTP